MTLSLSHFISKNYRLVCCFFLVSYLASKFCNYSSSFLKIEYYYPYLPKVETLG